MFRRVLRRLGREISEMLEEGMSSAQFMLMRLIDDAGALTVSEASESLGVTLSAVTLLADRLYAAGWLFRERDESDRRIVRLRLTEAGHAKVKDLEARQIAFMRRYLGQLPEEDQERLLEIYERLADIMDESAPRPENRRQPAVNEEECSHE